MFDTLLSIVYWIHSCGEPTCRSPLPFQAGIPNQKGCRSLVPRLHCFQEHLPNGTVLQRTCDKSRNLEDIGFRHLNVGTSACYVTHGPPPAPPSEPTCTAPPSPNLPSTAPLPRCVEATQKRIQRNRPCTPDGNSSCMCAPPAIGVMLSCHWGRVS